MNKAFVREPEPDGRGFCPRCGSLGESVTSEPMDTHICEDSRKAIGDAAWFCGFARCEVAYFNEFDSLVTVEQLKAPVYPKDPDVPMCACFGFQESDVEADVSAGTPSRIRELLTKSKSPEARCRTLAANGKCCMAEVQRLYIKLTGQSEK